MTRATGYPPPRFDGPDGEVSTHLRRGDGAPDLMLGNTAVHHLATGGSTEGQFGL